MRNTGSNSVAQISPGLAAATVGVGILLWPIMGFAPLIGLLAAVGTAAVAVGAVNKPRGK